jgi:NADH dehydrogenase/NADH:ubiquinone oxidoreductase subunit G
VTADAIGSEWPETKENKKLVAKGDRRERYTKAKGKGKVIEKVAADAEEMGEEAAEAAYGGKGKTRAKNVDELADRLSKAKVPDNMLVDESSDEEPVTVPGRLRSG